MNKFIGLILVGLLGYIAYPYMPPRLIGLKAPASIEQADELVNLPDEPVAPPVVIPEVSKNEDSQPREIKPDVTAMEDDIPEIEEEPREPEEERVVKKLDETDLKKIITTGVETGRFIDFRKNNIISWALKEQSLSLQGSQYEGEIIVEIGTLFGAKLKRVKVVIENGEISEWAWIETDVKK